VIVLAQFDVFREDKRRFCWATVVEVDCSGSVMRICFRFPKTKDNYIEWLEFGSPRICPFKSKVHKKGRRDPKVDDKSKVIKNDLKNPKEDVSFVASNPMVEASFSVGGKSQSHLTKFPLILHP
jgi:hypothetical protein